MKRIISLIVLFFGNIWIYLNVFYLPFVPWTEGLYRSWLVLQGLVPYRDFWWDRGLFDLYFLAGLFKLFGLNQFTYQFVVFSLFVIIGLLIFFLFRKKSFTLAIVSYISYILLLFPLFINAEIEEVIIGLFSLLTFYFLLRFFDRKKSLFLFLAGITSGLSFVTKQTSSLLILITVVFLLINYRKKTNLLFSSQVLRKILIYAAGILIPFLIMIAYVFFKGGLEGYLYNQYFTFVIYPKWAKPWGISEGLKMMMVFSSVLIPFIFIRTNSLVNKNLKLLLILFTIGLFATLLPSYWSYRLVSALPLFSVLFSLYIFDCYFLIKNHNNQVKKLMVFISAVVFIFFFGYFLNQYLQFVKSNGFQKGQYILDYGENEEKVASWLIKNTNRDEKIFNISNNIIMVKAKKLPQNRYVGGMPIDYLPFDETYAKIISNSPNIVVFQDAMLSEWPELKNWKFIDYLKTNYILKEKFGDIGIYVFKI